MAIESFEILTPEQAGLCLKPPALCCPFPVKSAKARATAAVRLCHAYGGRFANNDRAQGRQGTKF